MDERFRARARRWAPMAALLGPPMALLAVELLRLRLLAWPLLLTAEERSVAVRLALAGVARGLLLGFLWIGGLLVLTRRRWGRWLAASFFGGMAALLAWALTDGRWASQQPWRLPAVVGLSLGAAWVGGWGLRRLWDELLQRPVVAALLGVVGPALLAAVDASVLVGLYEGMHLLLRIGSASLAALAGLALGVARLDPWHDTPARRMPLVLGTALLLLAEWQGLGLARTASANALLAVQDKGGLSAAFLRLQLPRERFGEGEREPESSRSAALAEAGGAPYPAAAAGDGTREGLGLREPSLLLITVDALRADLLAAYGGSGAATAAMDRLAAEGVVFERAYTPAPHTSYAVASLLSGTYAREVLALGGEGARFGHETLAEVLRRYGVRTAAFYPPAVFFVDGERFAPLRERGFGFDYRKEMFASAAERVEQLRAWLGEPGLSGRPLFAWVHLFEPHEPYEPPEGFARGATDRARYEGEVRYVDRAVGELVAAFRAARPGATVILTSDHGEAFGEHGARFHGSALYEEQARVPLIWSSPGALPPGRRRAPVDLPDLAPSWLAALGLPAAPRMMGEDLVPLLRGEGEGPSAAFASVRQERMAVETRFKLLCRGGRALCRLFDLVADPAERRDVSARHPEALARLKEALATWMRRVPWVEAAALQEGVGWPEALARARLGDPQALPEVLGLLRDERPAVRAEAARVLGEAGAQEAGEGLRRLLQDPAPRVRAEAAVALGRLGVAEAGEPLRRLLGKEETARPLRWRAALALGRLEDRTALAALRELAFERGAPEALRIEALDALGRLRDRGSVLRLAALLFDEREVRLRAPAARALGAIGDRRAVGPLRRRLREEPYDEAREAEEAALSMLASPRR